MQHLLTPRRVGTVFDKASGPEIGQFPISNGDPAVYDHEVESLAVLMRILVRCFVGYSFRIKYREISDETGTDDAAIMKRKGARRQRSHAPDRIFECEYLPLSDEVRWFAKRQARSEGCLYHEFHVLPGRD
jgi:hypothetical protein